MLHLVFDLSLVTTLERLSHQAGIIFLNNAVLRLLKNSTMQLTVTHLLKTTPCYVLDDDLTLHGIERDLLIDGVIAIDYAQFVQLTVNYTPIQTWT